jgi:Uncharacterised nucleotidyltransferase
MRSLLEVLRGHEQHSFDDSEWTDLLDLADEENVLSWVAERLLLQEGGHSPERQKRLNAIHREAQLSSVVWIATLKSLLSAFERASLPVISLKGPCLAERLFGDAALRTCYDLDLLVRNSDLAAAENVLTNLGFRPNGCPDDYHHAWSRSGINVELHHNVENPFAFNFDLSTAWARANQSTFQGVPVWLLAPTDELVYLCLHGVRHRFERLCLILDLVFAFRILPVASAEAPERHDPEFDNVLALGWMMATRLDPQTPGAVFVSPADLPRLEKLADQLWNERMLGPAEILDWAAQHHFYLELETPGWRRLLRRWRHLRILLTRLIDDDFDFAKRFNLHRNWQVRLLRPIRLLIKNFHTLSRTV